MSEQGIIVYCDTRETQVLGYEKLPFRFYVYFLNILEQEVKIFPSSVLRLWKK